MGPRPPRRYIEVMHYQVTVRYGRARPRYHTYRVEASDARTALSRAAEGMPSEIVPEADLVELRVAPDPETRTYLGEDGGRGPAGAGTQ